MDQTGNQASGGLECRRLVHMFYGLQDYFGESFKYACMKHACMKHACSSQTRYLEDSCGGAKGTCRIRLSDCRWRMALFSNFLLLPKVPLPAYNISLETKNYGATDVPCYPHLCGTFIVNTVKIHNK